MAYDFWINNRATAAYVTDGAGQNHLIVDGGGYPEQYPVTRGGFTYGWDSFHNSDLQLRNRNAGNDPRLAGTAFATVATIDLKIDLPSAGVVDVALGIGDNDNNATEVNISVYDNVTLKFTVSGTGPVAGRYWDANGTEHTSAANWVLNQTRRRVTFASTTMIVRINTPAGSGVNSPLATVGVQSVSSQWGPQLSDQWNRIVL